MTHIGFWRRAAALCGAALLSLLAACNTPPAFQVSEPSAREGTVVSITQDTVQNVNSTVGGIGGALIAEFKFGVPWWGQVLLWGILTPLAAVFLLSEEARYITGAEIVVDGGITAL